MRPASGLTIAAGLLAAGAAGAQTPARGADSLARRDSAARVEPVVVTAERTATPLATSAAAVTRLSADDLRRLPARTVAEALRFVPGLAVLQGDALGDAPRIVVRGFYGGGETEYMAVLLNGVPLNGLGAGTVSWDLVPLAAVRAIEVVRGGASSLYGDAALGGVVNLITRGGAPYSAWRVLAGDHGIVRGSAAVEGQPGGRRASAFGDVRRSTGYRAHERRDAQTVGGSLALVEADGGARTLTLSALSHRRAFDDPGPLSDSALAVSRRDAAPIYRFDETDEQLHRLTLDGTAVAGRAALRGYVAGEYGRADVVRTVPLSPEFADTKARATRSPRVLGSLQLQAPGVLGDGRDRLVIGTDFTAGRLTSEYRNVVSGDAGAYTPDVRPADALDASGRGRRAAAAAFATWEATPVEPLRVTLGGRFDWMDDLYEPSTPDDGAALRATHAAFSPRASANLRWVDAARHTGHVYVSAGRSFKAPTIDQLFDQRRTPVPFPPYAITTSNPRLEPQYAATLEAGAYHRVTLVPGVVDARLALSAYQADVKNELDFDLQSFRYVNIGRSRHRGVEAGLTLAGPGAGSAFVNYTQQDATSRLGANEGRFLKAVPRRVLVAGVARAASTGLSGTLSATRTGETFLDDANVRTLPASTQLDLRASYPVRGLSLSLDVRNLLGERYSSTGFPDPAGGPTTYYYPASGRVVMLGIGRGW